MIDKDVQKSIDAFRMALDMTTGEGGDEYLKLCLKEYLWLKIYIP